MLSNQTISYLQRKHTDNTVVVDNDDRVLIDNDRNIVEVGNDWHCRRSKHRIVHWERKVVLEHGKNENHLENAL